MSGIDVFPVFEGKGSRIQEFRGRDVLSVVRGARLGMFNCV
jgi:hypothetical protein